jgi:hypothetical protein
MGCFDCFNEKIRVFQLLKGFGTNDFSFSIDSVYFISFTCFYFFPAFLGQMEFDVIVYLDFVVFEFSLLLEVPCVQLS